MSDSSMRRPVSFKWGLIAAIWTLFGLFFASEVLLSRSNTANPRPVLLTLAQWLVCAYAWFALTPLVLKLARRFPLGRARWSRNLLVHLFAAAVVSFIHLASYATLASLFGWKPANASWISSYKRLVTFDFHFDYVTYWAIIGIEHSITYYRNYRERERETSQLEVRAAQLEARLAQARLDALKMQLHPHFLFNTLNSISVLMREDVITAERMLVQLSNLLRANLENGDHEVSLKRELSFVESYLEIEQMRFQDRLRVSIDVDPETFDASLPNLILQPLVENAIRHGIARRAGAGFIRIDARKENGWVRISVSDNGPGLEESGDGLREGIGLASTRARLKQTYGAEHRFELLANDSGGVTVMIQIPCGPGRAERQQAL